MNREALIFEQEKQDLVRRKSFAHGNQYWLIWENYVAVRNDNYGVDS